MNVMILTLYVNKIKNQDVFVMSDTMTEMEHVKKVCFLAYQIRISACFTCAYKSYLTHVISPGAG